MEDIGLLELVAGISAYWIINKYIYPVQKKTKEAGGVSYVEDCSDEEVVTVMDEVRHGGGIDPVYVDRLESVLKERGIKYKISDRKDIVRTFSELVVVARKHAPEFDRKIIAPPPAPNSERAINLTNERLL